MINDLAMPCSPSVRLARYFAARKAENQVPYENIPRKIGTATRPMRITFFLIPLIVP
jgi:hypothetical protein